MTGFEGLDHFRRGNDREALELLHKYPGWHFIDVLRLFATLHSDAYAAEREDLLTSKGTNDRNGPDPWAIYIMRRASGRKRQADEGMRAYLRSGDMLQPNLALWEGYYRSDEPDREMQLIRAMNGSFGQLGRAYYEIGIRHLGEGNRPEARTWLIKAAAHSDPDGPIMSWSIALVERMQLQPNWPKSIPARK